MRQINQQGQRVGRRTITCAGRPADDTPMNSFGLTTLIQFLGDAVDRGGGGEGDGTGER